MQGITPAGISLFTTLPAPIILPFPIVTPPHTTALAPIHTSSSIVIGFEVPIPSALCAGNIACPEHAKQTPGAINAFAPIYTGDVSSITQL